MARSKAMVAFLLGTALFASALNRERVVAQQAKPGNGETGARALEEQKSAPIQIVNRDYDLAKLRSETRPAEPVFRGRVLWVQKCAYCHDGLGQPTYKTLGPWIDQDLVKVLTDKFTKDFIMNGDAKMPAFKYALNDKQLDDLLAFLKTIPASDKPTPAQLAGRAAGEGSSD